MNRLIVKDLQRIAIHCGYRTETTKSARLKAIADSSDFYDGILAQTKPKRPFNILSIDVGLKNFSYSKVSYMGKKADVKDWTVLNLHDSFGTPDYIDEGSLVDSKAYMAKLAVSVVDNVLVSKLWVPNIITIENQRTRSNSSKATLPNVLLNFTLEHMLYAAFAARQNTLPAYQHTAVMPMNSNKMVNYWLTRYTAKSCLYSPSRSKTYRKTILYGWFKEPHLAPFDISSFTDKLPSGFASMGTTLLNNSLKLALNIVRTNTKVDDLVDSLLYNISTARLLAHHQEIKKLLAKDDKEGIIELLDEWDREHIKFILPLLRGREDLYLAKEYEDLE